VRRRTLTPPPPLPASHHRVSMKVFALQVCLLAVAAGQSVLVFEDTDGDSCSVTKTGDKLTLSSECCMEDDCITSLADRLTSVEASLATANIAIATANIAIAANTAQNVALAARMTTAETTIATESPTNSPTQDPTKAPTICSDYIDTSAAELVEGTTYQNFNHFLTASHWACDSCGPGTHATMKLSVAKKIFGWKRLSGTEFHPGYEIQRWRLEGSMTNGNFQTICAGPSFNNDNLPANENVFLPCSGAEVQYVRLYKTSSSGGPWNGKIQLSGCPQ
jgi:hypothetical protein